MFFRTLNSKPTASDRLRERSARYRAQAIFQSVVASNAIGDHFNGGRLEFVRLVQMSMGIERDRAGQLIENALAGHPVAIAEVLRHLERIVYDAG